MCMGKDTHLILNLRHGPRPLGHSSPSLPPANAWHCSPLHRRYGPATKPQKRSFSAHKRFLLLQGLRNVPVTLPDVFSVADDDEKLRNVPVTFLANVSPAGATEHSCNSHGRCFGNHRTPLRKTFPNQVTQSCYLFILLDHAAAAAFVYTWAH